ncbi:MAG: rhodanese-like domain-containing protein [Planctomycetota bacterium]
MSFEEITPQEAHDRLEDSASKWAYIDVRSEPEFEGGHPAGAVNIPIFHLDPMTQQMSPNPDFVRVVEAHFAKDSSLVLGCQKGGRSARAAQMLVDAGYANVVNMLGGYGGVRDDRGTTIQAGWEESGLPIEEEASPGTTYRELKSKAD